MSGLYPPASGELERHSVPPSTDAEWARALQLYGVDRPFKSHPGSPTTSSSAAKPSQLLIHQESYSEDCIAGKLPDWDEAAREAAWKKDLNKFDWNTDVHILAGTAADDRHTSPASTSQCPGAGTSAASAAPQLSPCPNAAPSDEKLAPAVDLTFTQLTPSSGLCAFEEQYVVSEAVGLPRPVHPDADHGHLCATAEKRRLRAFYEQEGWLPAPNPSITSRTRRSAAIRRLGLNNDDDTGERYAVISKYCEMAQLIFGTDGGVVAVLHGDREDVYVPNRSWRKWSFPAGQSLAGHAVLNPEGRCIAIGDMDEDWRFKNNPDRTGVRKMRFFAAAPLRYHRSGNSDQFVDFGALCILDYKPRDKFDSREQGILLRLANMLVFQLATLQSEIMAKRSSGMYEASINFLRRSFVPEHLKPTASQEPKPAKEKPKKRLSKKKKLKVQKTGNLRLEVPRPRGHRSLFAALDHSHHRDSPTMASKSEATRSVVSTPPTGTPVSTRASSPPAQRRAIKTGPRDSQRAKRADLASETLLFNDAAETLRGILHADAVTMVDLHEYQLFIRKTSRPGDDQNQTREAIVGDFLQGKEWPSNVEPVVNHVPRSENSGVEVLGQSAATGWNFDFDQPNVVDIMGEFIKRYLSTRAFWWDREDPEDKLATQLMAFMPDKSQTVLATVFMTYTGTLRYASFVVWDRKPATFDDSCRLALPFVWIIGAALASSLAMNRIRNVEESQITYSNLQAHELRTPLHQILAITQLLRSSMSELAEQPSVAQLSTRGSMTTLEQVRDLLPFLDAIDTSGKTLHGIVDNILTFLDLTANDNKWESARAKHPLFSRRSAQPATIGAMMEELVREAYDENLRSRIGTGQSEGSIETVLEIIPKGLGLQLTEDRSGALRRALARLIHNAYRYIDGPGCVEIYVDDVKSFLPPEGCEDLSATRKISIHIVDNGHGMAQSFVDEKLGEPWAKEDLYATGSGLSVHLAYRIIDLMGGQMEISSAPGEGCIVSIEVPVPVAEVIPEIEEVRRKVALYGFTCDEAGCTCSIERLAASLERQYITLGCEMVPIEDAEVLIVDGSHEADLRGLLDRIKGEVVIFEADESLPIDIAWAEGTRVRRLRKPITPAAVLASLEPAPPPVPLDGETAETIARRRLRTHFEDKPAEETNPAMQRWKQRGVCVEEAVASLCLGDYFSSCGRTGLRQPSISSGTSATPTESDASRTLVSPFFSGGSTGTPITTPSEEGAPSERSDPPEERPKRDDLRVHAVENSHGLEHAGEKPPAPAAAERVTVLVVEDNVINRKILVKILNAGNKAALEVHEAEDGEAAVSLFKSFSGPAIVLLDINMPKMDGYAAAMEMRVIERRRGSIVLEEGKEAVENGRNGSVSEDGRRSRIFAVTALAGEDERRRGLVECGMDGWLTKPCPKATLQKVVEQARRELLGV